MLQVLPSLQQLLLHRQQWVPQPQLQLLHLVNQQLLPPLKRATRPLSPPQHLLLLQHQLQKQGLTLPMAMERMPQMSCVMLSHW